MKILGIGVDVVNNRRIQPLIKNQNFIKRTFGPNININLILQKILLHGV